MKTASPSIAAAGMLLAPLALAANVIDQGTGFGTFYYDLVDTTACNNDFSSMDSGYVECSNSPLSLAQIGSNNLVAMDHVKLAADPSKYCGKQVVVSVNGVASDVPFFIGDGCQRCGQGSPGQTVWNSVGAPGLDFSYSQLNALSSNACNAGHIDISWEILDNTIYDFEGQEMVGSAGSAGSAGSVGSQTSAAQTESPSSALTSAQASIQTSAPAPAQLPTTQAPTQDLAEDPVQPPALNGTQSIVQPVSRTGVPTTLQTAVQTAAAGGCGVPPAV